MSNMKSVEDKVPPKEKLITMTEEQLAELRKSIVKETAEILKQEDDKRERLRVQLERDSALKKVDNKGQFADPAMRVIRSGTLSPVDHQSAVAAPYTTESSMKYRFINRTNEALYALRRHQGYEPILDESGNEVRYMDGLLTKMPMRKYEETILAETRARKMLKKQAAHNAAENFAEMARREGVEVTGDGLKVDITRGSDKE